MKARPFAQRTIVQLIQFGALGVVAASLLGHLSRHHFLLELFSHFRVQYAVLLISAALLLIIARSWKLAGVAASIAVMNTIIMAPRFLPAATAAAPVGSAVMIRLLVQNVNTANARHQLLLDLIEREDPDVILLLEVDRRWMESLRSLDERYPRSISSPREDNFGIALWSRLELRDSRIEPMTDARIPTILTEVSGGAGAFRLIGTHTLPPVRPSYAAGRDEHLRRIAREVKSQPDLPTVVCGDLNVSPWSSAFRDLLGDGELQDTARGLGLQRTWPASSWVLRIPIDHILTTRGVSTITRRVGPDIGSDHLGLIADLQITSRP